MQAELADKLYKKYMKTIGMRDELIAKAKMYKMKIQEYEKENDMKHLEEMNRKVDKLKKDLYRYNKVFDLIRKEWEDAKHII